MTHIPVLLTETLAAFAPQSGDHALDVTLGLGGHSEAILRCTDPDGTLIALDADAENLEAARRRLAPFGDRCLCVHSNFSALPDCLPPDRRAFDVILADLGLSSPHVDDASRGFTFRSDAPLDMRYDRSSGQSAAMLLASADRVTLIDVLKEYGEIRGVHRLVDAVIAHRKDAPVRTSGDLRDAAKEAFGYKAGDLLPQIFQALRIAVNDEMGALKRLLDVAPTLLAPGGRFVVLSYHSLEDRLVKQCFRTLTTPLRDELTGADASLAGFTLLTKKPIAPSEKEQRENPRSRSALLRAICRRS